ncbi:MAG: FAD-dependent oxidoreductase [Acidobacteria bacterium]|nr:FAD-dependent oxidoreductase [Acidobacteriota bacterium]MCA1649527.1 FAD-dependent oxidoreductase [Acidobacteriota bacterium]
MALAEFDLAIVGAGAAGLIAARFAAQLGARVLLAERDRIGGDCTWTGCVPSKSLIRVARAAHEIRTAGRFGIGRTSCSVDMSSVRDYVRAKVDQIYQPTAPEALEREGIHVALGPASFENDRTLRIGERSVTARRYVVCTGAAPVTPSLTGLETTPHFTYHDIFDATDLAESLIVIGGGPLGMELAQAFQRLGSKVTIVAPRLLPHDDPEAADVLRRVCEREGVRWVRGRAVGVRQDAAGLIVASDAGIDASGATLLVAAGRRPNISGLALDRAGVIHSERGIPVDDRLRTNVPHIYAAGDVLGGEQFSHIAGWQAFEATRNALLPGSSSGRPNPMAWVTFTDPEVAQVGVSEAAARRRFGDAITVTRWDIACVDRAACDDDEDGFIKLIVDRRGVLIGATIVASRAGELSGELSLAIARRLRVGEVASAVHAYPTYATALQQMSSQVATARWTSSAAGRFIGSWLGFAGGR